MKNFFYIIILSMLVNNINGEVDQVHHEKLHKALTDSKILHFLDGNLIDKDVIKNTRWAVQEIMKMRLGEFDKVAKKRLDSLTLHGKTYLSIQALIKIEDIDGKADEESLVAFKERFDEIVKPLMQKAKGAERFMIKFIQESCKARDRETSILMDWKGDEHDKSFKQKIKTFKDLNVFFTDMLNFFYDLNIACPKAVKSYEDGLKK